MKSFKVFDGIACADRKSLKFRVRKYWNDDEYAKKWMNLFEIPRTLHGAVEAASNGLLSSRHAWLREGRFGPLRDTFGQGCSSMTPPHSLTAGVPRRSRSNDTPQHDWNSQRNSAHWARRQDAVCGEEPLGTDTSEAKALERRNHSPSPGSIRRQRMGLVLESIVDFVGADGFIYQERWFRTILESEDLE